MVISSPSAKRPREGPLVAVRPFVSIFTCSRLVVKSLLPAGRRVRFWIRMPCPASAGLLFDCVERKQSRPRHGGRCCFALSPENRPQGFRRDGGVLNLRVTLAMDVCSRMVDGLYLTMEAPPRLSTSLCLLHSIFDTSAWLREREISEAWPIASLPDDNLHVDNGADFRRQSFKRGCQDAGIAIDGRPPGEPRFGGHIERLTGTPMENSTRSPVGATFTF